MNYYLQTYFKHYSFQKVQLRWQCAFTLVEMLIAIVLSSIIFVSSYQIISQLIQYQVRARVQQEDQIDKLLLTNMLSQIIEKGIHQYDLYNPIAKQAVFKGGPDSIQLISRAYSKNFDQPGHRVYRLYRQEGELYVDYRQYDADYLSNQQFKLPSGIKIEALNFEYFDENDWVDTWSDDKKIPRFIRITVELPNSKSLQLIRTTERR